MVCVLLSTYNGECFLDEQIESLTRQEDVELKILVRDDGSLDSTPQILDQWQRKGVLSWYKGSNVGFAMSFLDLIMNAPKADYYAFCDQDDIWLPNKLKEAISKLKQLPFGAQLYCSNLYIYRNGINEGLWWKKKPQFDIYRCMVQNIATGCTVVFNDVLRNIIVDHPPQKIALHDFWLYQTAMLFGHVCFDENAYIYYRQHAHNQIGSKSRFRDKIYAKLKSFQTVTKQHYREKEAKRLLLYYGDILPNRYIKMLKVVAYYREMSRCRMVLFFSNKYVMTNRIATLWLKLRVLIGSV